MPDNVAATSAFNPAITDIITSMYRDLDVITDSETPTAGQFNEALFKMNSLVKSMEATGIHVWTEEEAILFLQPLQARYQIGLSSSGAASPTNAHTADADAWLPSSLAQSYSAAASALTLTSPVGVMGDNIGIVLGSGVTFWTTIASVPSLDQVTITAPLPGAASSGSIVLGYPAGGEIARPLKVPNARLLTFAANTGAQGPQETPMTILSRQGYMDLPNKLSQGTPTQWFYTPQRNVGYLYVWPVPSVTNWAVRFTWYRPLADLLVPNNTLDFPQEWVTPLRWLLANEMRLGFSLPAKRSDDIKEQASNWMDIVASWDRESEPIQFGMDYQY